MCDPASAAIGLGVAQMGAGMMQAQEEAAMANAVAQQRYQQAKAAAQRNNAIATQQYNNRLQIAKHKDEIKKQDYEAQLKAHEAAMQASFDKSKLDAAEFNRASAETSAKARALELEAAFAAEENLATMIRSQGELLSTGSSGQSFLLQTQDSLKILGQAQERVAETLFNQHQQLGLELQGIGMDYVASEWSNYNSIPGTPQSQKASLSPYEPIKDMGPAAPIRRSATTGMISAVVSGVGTGLSVYGGLGGDFNASTP